MELGREAGGEHAVKYTHGIQTNVCYGIRCDIIPVLKKAGLLGRVSHSLPRPRTVTL